MKYQIASLTILILGLTAGDFACGQSNPIRRADSPAYSIANAAWSNTNHLSSAGVQDSQPKPDPQQKIQDYLRPIGELNASGASNLAPSNVGFPIPVAPPIALQLPRSEWCGSSLVWQVPNFYHRHLYFEDYRLERCGYNYGIWQPSVSGIKFVLDTAAVPVNRIRYPYRKLYYFSTKRFNDPHLYCY
jgi:hypothetical protein